MAEEIRLATYWAHALAADDTAALESSTGLDFDPRYPEDQNMGYAFQYCPERRGQ